MHPVASVTMPRGLAWLIAAALLSILTACSGVLQLAGPTPTPELLQLTGEFVGDIRLGKPVTVKATVVTLEAVPHLEIVAFSSAPTTVLEGADTCWVDTKAGVPAACTFTFRLEHEGLHSLVLQAVSRATGRKYAPLDVQVTRAGATINPPSSGPRAEIEKVYATPSGEP